MSVVNYLEDAKAFFNGPNERQHLLRVGCNAVREFDWRDAEESLFST